MYFSRLLPYFFYIFNINAIIQAMITIKVNKNNLENLEKTYINYIVERNIGYILFVIKTDKNILTAYDNKKGNNFKVTIQGENAHEIAEKWTNSPATLPKKTKDYSGPICYLDIDEQIGSDEVGTGDFFGPIVVCACYSNHDTMKVIEDYKITDSKKMSDQKILQIIPSILKKVHFSCKIFSDENYNEAIRKGYNMNQIKAFAHNYVLTKLHKRCPYVKNIYVDQFTPEEKYYDYLSAVSPENVQKNIVFREKGELCFPSVALASNIARYTFLQYMNELSRKYGVKIPLGASKDVNEFAKKFVDKFGIEEFNKIVKKNFKNYNEVTNQTTSLL